VRGEANERDRQSLEHRRALSFGEHAGERCFFCLFFFFQSNSDRRCLQRSERCPTLDRICREPLATAALSLFSFFSA
jgi:hypothetical protein